MTDLLVLPETRTVAGSNSIIDHIHDFSPASVFSERLGRMPPSHLTELRQAYTDSLGGVLGKYHVDPASVGMTPDTLASYSGNHTLGAYGVGGVQWPGRSPVMARPLYTLGRETRSRISGSLEDARKSIVLNRSSDVADGVKTMKALDRLSRDLVRLDLTDRADSRLYPTLFSCGAAVDRIGYDSSDVDGRDGVVGGFLDGVMDDAPEKFPAVLLLDRGPLGAEMENHLVRRGMDVHHEEFGSGSQQSFERWCEPEAEVVELTVPPSRRRKRAI